MYDLGYTHGLLLTCGNLNSNNFSIKKSRMLILQEIIFLFGGANVCHLL